MEAAVTRSFPLLLALSLTACTGPEGPEGPDPVEPDPEPTQRATLDLEFQGDTDRTDLVVEVYALPRFTRVASSPVADGRARVHIPGPDDTLFIDAADHPGTRQVEVVFVTFIDSDGDGGYSDGEPFVGTSARWSAVTYLEGVGPALIDQGLGEGWNVLDTEGTALDPSRIPLPLDLLPTDTLRLAGTNAVDHPELRLAVVPMTLEQAGVEPLVDRPLAAGAWELTLRGAPPDNHYEPDVFPGVIAEMPIAYLDLNPPAGPLGDIEDGYLAVCHGTSPVVLGWVMSPTSIFDALTLSMVRAEIGWEAWSLLDDNVLPAEHRASLTISEDSCP